MGQAQGLCRPTSCFSCTRLGANIRNLHLQTPGIASSRTLLPHAVFCRPVRSSPDFISTQLLLIGGFNKHTDASEETEVVQSDISFDIMGDITVAPS